MVCNTYFLCTIPKMVLKDAAKANAKKTKDDAKAAAKLVKAAAKAAAKQVKAAAKQIKAAAKQAKADAKKVKADAKKVKGKDQVKDDELPPPRTYKEQRALKRKLDDAKKVKDDAKKVKADAKKVKGKAEVQNEEPRKTFKEKLRDFLTNPYQQNMRPLTPADLEECPICGDDEVADIIRCADGHKICPTCLKAHTRTRQDGRALEACVDPTCVHLLPVERVHAVLGTAGVEEYDFRRSTDHYNSKCPSCGKGLQIDNAERAGIGSCDACRFQFCLKCKDEIHPGSLCEEVIRAPKADVGKTLEVLEMEKAGFRQCPGCLSTARNPTTLPWIGVESGCNRVPCPTCKLNFCAICGQDMLKWCQENGLGTNVYRHFECLGKADSKKCTLKNCTHCPFQGPRKGDENNVAVLAKVGLFV